MLKIEIEVKKCLEMIKIQKNKGALSENAFILYDQSDIDIDFLKEKNVLKKNKSAYILQDDYKDIILQEKIINNFIIKKINKFIFILKPILKITNILKK